MSPWSQDLHLSLVWNKIENNLCPRVFKQKNYIGWILIHIVFDFRIQSLCFKWRTCGTCAVCSIQPQFYDDGLSLYTPQHVATESQRSEVNLKNNSCDLNGPSPKHSDPKSRISLGNYWEKQDLFYSLHGQQ